jgi:dTDP-4-dehydrorhamnose reductase
VESHVSIPEGLPKTAIIGASGFLGSTFLSVYRHIHHDCIGTLRKAQKNDFFTLDLLAPNITSLRLARTKHKEALIFAAISKIDRCETEKKLTRRVNVEGTLELIRQLNSEGIKSIFVSSDSVFDGRTGNYLDDSPLNPITEYGAQKAEVEARIDEICKGNYLIIRLSKIFSINKGDGTILDEMAGILKSGGTIRAAYDQIFCPTWISDLINVVLRIQEMNLKGTFNVCSPENWSRYDLAIKLTNAMGKNVDKVKRISLDDLGETFKRPKNTTLSVKNLQEKIDFSFTPVDQCIMKVAQNWK